MNIQIPQKMLVLNGFWDCQVLETPVLKYSGDEPSKKRNGLTAYRVRVNVPAYFYETGEVLGCLPRYITVWSDTELDFKPGEKIRFGTVAVDAYRRGNDAGIYIWAWGASRVDSLSDALGVE